jgi:gamma-glutamylcyclotransferase (GGCT)/AIG2-like uncharacterized protein YtfP
MTTGEYLFVYGTLLPGLIPEHLRETVEPLRRVGAGRLRGRLYDLGPFPAAIPDAAAPTLIVGQVLELPPDPAVLQQLDRYEAYVPDDREKSPFVRGRHVVTSADGRETACWVYAYNRDPGEAALIEHGDYVRWLAERPLSRKNSSRQR